MTEVVEAPPSGTPSGSPAAAADETLTPGQAWYLLFALFVAYTLSFIDRTILSLLVEPIRRDLGLTDTEISLLHGFAFAIFYTSLGVPLAWVADRRSRRGLIGWGIAVWSAMTAACAFAGNFAQMFLARVGVGVGEAALSPAAYSMLADAFPKNQLSRVLGIYSTGVYVGAGLAFMIGGTVAAFAATGGMSSLPLIGTMEPWRLTFIIVGLPGLLVAALMWTVKEPPRKKLMAATGAAAGPGAGPGLLSFIKGNRFVLFAHIVGFSLVGLVFNGVLAWLPAMLIRRFEYAASEAGMALGLLILVFGVAGIVAGGVFSDAMQRRGHQGGPLYTGIISGIVLGPIVAAACYADTDTAVLLWLAPFFFFSSFPYGAAPAALQMMSPLGVRAQVSAVYLLVLNLIGIGLGPTAVASLTDFLYGDPKAVNQSMALVALIFAPLGAALLALGVRPFTRKLNA